MEKTKYRISQLYINGEGKSKYIIEEWRVKPIYNIFGFKKGEEGYWSEYIFEPYIPLIKKTPSMYGVKYPRFKTYEEAKKFIESKTAKNNYKPIEIIIL
jgi:hypothetical protein